MSSVKFGRYEVLGLLGEGSMGRVYRGFDPLGHRPVAIKTVRPQLLTPETAQEYLRRFRREAQAAGALSHPSIITIFDVGEDYFVMELLEGATLQALLRARGRLPAAEALSILGPVADALDYAHARGVIHRDVKPGNLMILPDGRPKMMDFGVAHLAATAMSVSGQFLGSPSYMAPERIQRGEATPSSDLFSLAVVAYESLTGRKPFPGDTVSEVVARVVKEQPPPPRSLNPELPAEHAAVFRRALAKDPAARHPSAAVFLAALSGQPAEASIRLAPPVAHALAPPAAPQLASEPAESVQSGTLVDVPEELRVGRRSEVLRLGMAGAALLLVSTVTGYWLNRPAPEPAPALLPAAPAAAGARAARPPGLTVETKPSGARVWLDGVEVGVSPLTLTDLTPGRHTVNAAHEGLAAELGVELGPDTGVLPLTLPLYPVGAAPVRQAVRAPDVPASPGASGPGEPGAEAQPVDGAPPPAGEVTTSHSAIDTGAAPAELDAPASPPELVSGEPVSYPSDALRLRMRGAVAVEFVVQEDGRVAEIQIVAAPHQFLSDAVLQAVKSWRYTPAHKDGRPVRYRLAKSFDFDPDKAR